MLYDVVIPLKSTNSLVVENLKEISRCSEVGRILIGDAGVDVHLIEEIRGINKIEVINQADIYSQGSCIIDLIRRVSTDYFVYLHGDVTLPENWFRVMAENLGSSKLAECGRVYQYSIRHEERHFQREYPSSRPLSGSQMGDTKFFLECTEHVDDDFLFRNEDLVFADLVDKNGGDYKIINQTHHFHQIGFDRINENIKPNSRLAYSRIPSQNDVVLFKCQVQGILKYTRKKDWYMTENLIYALVVLKSFGESKFISDLLNEPSYKAWHFTIRVHSLYCFIARFRKVFKTLIQSNRDIFESR